MMLSPSWVVMTLFFTLGMAGDQSMMLKTEKENMRQCKCGQ